MNDPEILREWIVDGAEIIAANYGLNAATEFGKQVLEECGRVAGVRTNLPLLWWC